MLTLKYENNRIQRVRDWKKECKQNMWKAALDEKSRQPTESSTLCSFFFVVEQKDQDNIKHNVEHRERKILESS